jgi:hypothetical protein
VPASCDPCSSVNRALRKARARRNASGEAGLQAGAGWYAGLPMAMSNRAKNGAANRQSYAPTGILDARCVPGADRAAPLGPEERDEHVSSTPGAEGADRPRLTKANARKIAESPRRARRARRQRRRLWTGQRRARHALSAGPREAVTAGRGFDPGRYLQRPRTRSS